MSSHTQYISVLSPSATGNITFHLESYVDNPEGDPNVEPFPPIPDITEDITVAVDAGDDEPTIARNIETTFKTFFTNNSIQYLGSPPFSNEIAQPLYQVRHTDHVAMLWSPAQFRITATSYPANLKMRIGPNPVFLTIAEAKSYSRVTGVDLTDEDDNQLSDEDIGLLLELASDECVKLVNNKIVVTTFLHEEVGRRTKSILLKARPVIDFDLPMTRRPYIIGITSVLITKALGAFNLNRQRGELNYRFTNDLIEISEPFDMENEVKMTYRAGYMSIPRVVKQAVIRYAGTILEDPDIKRLKGGTLDIEWRPPLETQKWILTILRDYRLGDS